VYRSEPRQRVVQLAERTRRLSDVTEVDLASEQPRSLDDRGERLHDLAYRTVPAEEHQRPADKGPVVGDDSREPRHQLAPFGIFAAVQPDRLGRVTQSHQCIAE